MTPGTLFLHFSIIIFIFIVRNVNGVFYGMHSRGAEFPHIVQLYADGYFLCGGSLINSRTVLTAAHCVSDWYPVTSIITGGRGEGSVTRNVKKWIRHPIWDSQDLYSYEMENREWSWASVYNNTDGVLDDFVDLVITGDIALIILEDPIYENNYDDERSIRFLNIPSDDEVEGREAWTVGHGMTEYGSVSYWETQKAFIKYVFCGSDKICAFTLDQEDTRQHVYMGDSGSSVVFVNSLEDTRFSGVGVCSFISRDLEDTELSSETFSLTAYTRTSFYKEWIEENMYGGKSNGPSAPFLGKLNHVEDKLSGVRSCFGVESNNELACGGSTGECYMENKCFCGSVFLTGTECTVPSLFSLFLATLILLFLGFCFVLFWRVCSRLHGSPFLAWRKKLRIEKKVDYLKIWLEFLVYVLLIDLFCLFAHYIVRIAHRIAIFDSLFDLRIFFLEVDVDVIFSCVMFGTDAVFAYFVYSSLLYQKNNYVLIILHSFGLLMIRLVFFFFNPLALLYTINTDVFRFKYYFPNVFIHFFQIVGCFVAAYYFFGVLVIWIGSIRGKCNTIFRDVCVYIVENFEFIFLNLTKASFILRLCAFFYRSLIFYYVILLNRLFDKYHYLTFMLALLDEFGASILFFVVYFIILIVVALIRAVKPCARGKFWKCLLKECNWLCGCCSVFSRILGSCRDLGIGLVGFVTSVIIYSWNALYFDRYGLGSFWVTLYPGFSSMLVWLSSYFFYDAILVLFVLPCLLYMVFKKICCTGCREKVLGKFEKRT